MSPDLKGLKAPFKKEMKHLPVPSIFRFHVRNFGGVIVLVCRDVLQAKFSDPGTYGISWTRVQRHFRCEKTWVQQQEVLKKKHEHVFLGGRNGFSKNSFTVVIQGDSQRWVYSGVVCYSIDILGNGNLKIIQESLMVDLLQLNTRIVLFKYSEFNHQTI